METISGMPGFENVSCALCGRDDARPFLRCGDIKGVAAGIFTLVRCRCGLVYMNPRPGAEAAVEMYTGEKFDYYTGGTSGHAVARAEILTAHSKGKRILEAGTGDGSFLAHMKSLGWDASGVEPDPDSARRQRERLGLDVRTGTIHTAELPRGAFDAIAYWDVFEHIADPSAELERAKELLAPGGIIAMSLPNMGSAEARIFGEKWYRLDVPRHLYHYTPKTLRAMLRKAGMSVVDIHCSTTATGVLNSMRPDRIAERQSGGTSGERHAEPAASGAKSKIKKAVFDYTLVPALRALDAMLLGGHMIAVAAKPGRD